MQKMKNLLMMALAVFVGKAFAADPVATWTDFSDNTLTSGEYTLTADEACTVNDDGSITLGGAGLTVTLNSEQEIYVTNMLTIAMDISGVSNIGTLTQFLSGGEPIDLYYDGENLKQRYPKEGYFNNDYGAKAWTPARTTIVLSYGANQNVNMAGTTTYVGGTDEANKINADGLKFTSRPGAVRNITQIKFPADTGMTIHSLRLYSSKLTDQEVNEEMNSRFTYVGGLNADNVVTIGNAINVKSEKTVRTIGFLNFTNGVNAVKAGGTLEVVSGETTFNTFKNGLAGTLKVNPDATFKNGTADGPVYGAVTLDIAGTLEITDGVRWSLGSDSQTILRDGAVLKGDGANDGHKIAYDYFNGATIKVEGDATIEGNIGSHIENTKVIAFEIAEGKTLTMSGAIKSSLLVSSGTFEITANQKSTGIGNITVNSGVLRINTESDRSDPQMAVPERKVITVNEPGVLELKKGYAYLSAEGSGLTKVVGDFYLGITGDGDVNNIKTKLEIGNGSTLFVRNWRSNYALNPAELRIDGTLKPEGYNNTNIRDFSVKTSSLSGSGIIEVPLTLADGATLAGAVTVTGDVTVEGSVTVLGDAGATVLTCNNAADIAAGLTAPEGLMCVVDGKTIKLAVKPVAQIGDTTYTNFADALAAAQAGDEIVLLADVAENVTVPAGVIFNGNGKQIAGTLYLMGDVTLKGHVKANAFDFENVGTEINIPAGATFEITGTGRMIIGHGCTFNITGTITDAKTADKATLTPSLIMPGASFTGAGVTFNVKNAYITAPSSYCSSSNSASGTFDFNIENSIIETAGKLAFEAQSTAATVNFELKNSVLNTGSHLVFGVAAGEVVIDNSNVNVGKSNQIENRSTMTVKNGSVVNGAVATSSNAINPGTIIVENATYAVTGQFSGSTVGTGTLIIKKGANVSVGSIVDKANIQIDATGMTADEAINFTANLSKFAGTVEVVNNDKLDASIVDGKIVLALKPVAQIGEQTYTTLEAAFAAATEGQMITLLMDATPALTSQRAITKAAVIDLGGKTLTLTEDDLYFGTTTFKNGTIVVDPSVRPSTAVFWMVANQTLTFDNVKLVATGVTGTYLIGLEDTNSNLNLLNGSEIIIDNDSTTGLTAVICDNGTDNNVVISQSTINVKNIEGRFYLGGSKGNIEVSDSTVVLNGVKEGFYLRAGQSLDIAGNSEVNIVLNSTEGRHGINVTDITATYTKAESATVNATLYKAPFKVSTYEELIAALAEDNAYVVLANDITATATQSSGYGKAGIVVDAGDVLDGNGKTLTINGANATWDCVIAMKGGEVKNLTIAGAMRGVFMPGANGDVVIDNCKFQNVIYTFNSDAGSKDYTVTIKNTELNGWTSFSDVHKSVTFENCSFAKGNGYAYCRPYQATTFNNCSFSGDFAIDCSQANDNKLAFDNCTYNGQAITSENAFGLFGDGSKVLVNGASADYTRVAQVGGQIYSDLQEAIKAAAPAGTVELLKDVVVDEWKMFSQNLTVSDNSLITLNMNGLTINGNGHSLTVNSISSPEREKFLFQGAENLTVSNLTITVNAKTAYDGGIGLKSGTIENVTFNGGRYAVLPGTGDVTVKDCTFNGVTGYAVYFEEDRDNLVITDNIFNCADGAYAVTLRGAATFTDNTVVKGKVNLANSAKGEVSGNNFGTERFKVYNGATSAITGNTINNLVFNDGSAIASTFTGNTLSDSAQGALDAVLLRGAGTEADPYVIKNLANLQLFRDSVNNGGTKYSAPGVWVALGADIDMAGVNWVGIGSVTAAHGFMGNFDGKEFKIKNLTITNPALDSDGYAYAGLFAVTEGTDKNNQNTIKNLTIENVTISTTGHIVSAAIAYPYYTIVENVNVCGNISIKGGDYTAGALAYTRRCVNASNVSVVGNAGSTITGGQAVGGVISDIQMNGGLTAVYSNFKAENLTITGTKMVGGISGIIATQALNGATVKDVTIVCSDARVGQVAGSFGGTSSISNIVVENVTGADAIIGGGYDGSKPVEAKLGDTFYSTFAEAYSKATAGDTITLFADMTASDIIVLDKAITLDGNGKTLTSTAGRAINVSGADGVTIKNLTINASGERAINIIQNATNVTIDNVTATAANYTVNVAASAPEAVVAIKNSTLDGLCTVNVAAAGAKVTVDNSTVNCNDNNTTAGESYAALCLNKAAIGGSIIATNTTVNVTAGSDSEKGRNGAENGTVTINGSTEGVTVTVAVITYAGTYNYHGFQSLAEAIEFAKAGDTITLIRDVTASEIITIDKAITLDGNGKTLTSTAARAINVSGADGVTIKNLTINASGERAINIIQNATNVTIDNVTATAANYTVNVAASAPEAVVAIKNSTLDGLCTVNVAAAGAKVTVDNSTVNCNDNNTTAGESYAALSLNKEAVGGTIAVTGTTINVAEGSDSVEARNGAENGTITIDGSTAQVNTIVAYITYPNSTAYHAFYTLQSAIDFAKAGDTITLLRDVTASEIITIEKAITLNGNGKTLTYTGSNRAIEMPNNAEAKLNVTLKNLTVDCTASYCQRGINYNDDGALVLNNVTVKGTNVTYALNLPGYSDNCVVEITDSSLTGNIALNVWGANSTITATNSEFVSVDNSNAEGYVAISLNNDGAGNAATGSVVTINGGKIIAKDENDEPSYAVRNSTATGKVNVSESTEVVGKIVEPVAIVTYGMDQFYSCATLQAAIDKAIETKGTVELLKDISASEIITINGSVVIDGKDHTLTSTAARAINVSGANGVTIKNLTINCSGERAINIIQNATNVTIDNVTATAANYTVNVASSAGAAKVAITGSTLTGLNVVNVAGAGADITINGGKITCNDQSAGENYAALFLNSAATNGKITATDVTFDIKGDSKKASNGAEGGVITIDGKTEGVSVPVAIITYGNNAYTFATLQDAVDYAQAGETIKVIAEVNVDAAIEVAKKVTIDLNGQTVRTTENDKSGDGVFCVVAGGDLTINDSVGTGVINGVGGNNYNIAIWANGGKVTINGGNFTNVGATDNTDPNAHFDLIYVKNSGEVVINGGTFECETPAFTLNSHDTYKGVITVNGGTFVGFDPRNNAAETAGTTFMAAGKYTFAEGGNYIIVTPEDYILNGVASNSATVGDVDSLLAGAVTVTKDGEKYVATATYTFKVTAVDPINPEKSSYELTGGKLRPGKTVAVKYIDLATGTEAWEKPESDTVTFKLVIK